MEIKQYYEDIRRENARLVKDLLAGKHPGQPEPELVTDEYGDSEKKPVAVYMTSVKNRAAMTVPGHTCLVAIFDAKGNPGIAATRIVEGTHRVATQEEIDACLERQAQQRRFHEETDLKFDGRARQFRVQLPE
jgi:hypothetical protein